MRRTDDGRDPGRPQATAYPDGQSAEGEAGDDGLGDGQRVDPEGQPWVDRTAIGQVPQRSEDDVEDAGGEHGPGRESADPSAVHPAVEDHPVEGPGRTFRKGGDHRHGGRVALGPGQGQPLEQDRAAQRDVAQPQLDLEDHPAVQLDIGEALHGQERLGKAVPGAATGDRGGAAAGVGVEAVAHHRQLGLVGVAGDHAGESLGHQASGLGPGRGVVSVRIRPGGHRCLPEGTVDPQQGGGGGHAGHDHHKQYQDAETDEPASRMLVQQVPDTGKEREQAEQEKGDERHGQQPYLADELPVEEPRTDELGDVAVEGLHVLEQRAG